MVFVFLAGTPAYTLPGSASDPYVTTGPAAAIELLSITASSSTTEFIPDITLFLGVQSWTTVPCAIVTILPIVVGGFFIG